MDLKKSKKNPYIMKPIPLWEIMTNIHNELITLAPDAKMLILGLLSLVIFDTAIS